MPALTLSTRAGVDTSTAMHAFNITGLQAAVDVNPCIALQINATTGRLEPLAAGFYVGIAAQKGYAASGLTAYGPGVRFHARDEADLIPGAAYFIGVATGTIDTIATAKDSQGAFLAVTTRDLMTRVWRVL